VEIVNVGAVLPGTDAARSKQAIVMTAHYDSMPSDVMDPKTAPPGATTNATATAMARWSLANALRTSRRRSPVTCAVAGGTGLRLAAPVRIES